ncbi:MAG: rhomboid family intramembrane serine protease [Bacteroidetes bacterium]|nr:MAG: rhomboid family intramembrane serine protease [Bacteroidota bacterium]
MFKSIWEDLRDQFRMGNMVTRLVILNVVVFVVVNIVKLLLLLFNGWDSSSTAFSDFLHFFSLSSSAWTILTHPWTIVTHMFLHEGLFHVLFNMLFLYWFGRIVGDFIGDRKILPLYLVGGLIGGAAYFASFNLLGYSNAGVGYALGASAGVMAIVVAAGAIAPDYIMRLLFLGNVKLKYIAGGLLVLDLVGIGNNYNTGGHFAHLGGAFFGWFFIEQLKKGNDLSIPVNRFLDKIFDFFSETFSGAFRRGPRVIYRNPNAKKKAAKGGRAPRSGNDSGPDYQERLDRILDKIKQSGYESLTAEEKEFLFNASNK